MVYSGCNFTSYSTEYHSLSSALNIAHDWMFTPSTLSGTSLVQPSDVLQTQVGCRSEPWHCHRYAIASYLLQSKDRHNGNILIDTQGRLVHIDFGFILEISPGANMRFESAAFKLSHEMTQLLDPSGQRDSPQFHLFEELCVRGFLAVSLAMYVVALTS